MEADDPAAMDEEQRFFQLERQVLEQQSQHVSLRKELDELRAAHIDLKQQKAKAEGRVDELERALIDRDERVAKAEGALNDSKTQSLDSHEVLADLKLSNKKLEDDLKAANDRAAASSQQVSEIQDKLDQVVAMQLPTKLGAEKAQQELGLLREQAHSIAKQVEEKNEALLKARSELAMKTTELSGRAEIAVSEASIAKEQLQTVNQRLESQSLELQALSEQLRNQKAESTQFQVVQKRALDAQLEVARMAQEQLQEKEGKMIELNSAVAASNTALEESKSQLADAQKEHEAAMESLKSSHLEEVQDLKALLGAAGAHEAVVAVPASLSAGEAGESAANEYMPKGATMSEVYSRLAEARQQLLAEQQQVRTLQESMEFILKEIEAKAPVIEQQHEDFNNLVRSHAQLAQRLADSASDKTAHAEEVARVKASVAEMEGFNQVLEKQAAQATQQLQRWMQSASGPDGTRTALLEAQAECQRLVKRTVQLELELQKQAAEGQHKVDQSLTLKLEEAFGMGESLKKDLEMMRSEASRIVGQRDLYKVLLQHAENKGSSSEDPVGPAGLSEVVQSSEAVEALQAELMKIKENKSTALAKLQGELDKSRAECAELRIDLARSKSHVEFKEERHTLLLKNTEVMRNELQALRDKNMEHTSILLGQQAEVTKALQLVEEQQQKTAQVSQELQQVSMEKMRAVRSEAALEARIVALSQDKARQARLLTDLEGIFQDFEKSGNLQKKRAAEELSASQQEVRDLRAALEKAQVEAKESRDRLQHQLSESVTNLESAEKKLVEHNGAKESLTNQLSEKQQRLSELEKELSGSQAQVVALSANVGADGSKQLAIEIAGLKSELTTSQQMIALKEEHVAQFKNIASANEKALLKAQQDHAAIEERLKGEAVELKATVSKLEAALKASEQSLGVKSGDVERLKQELNEQVESFDAEIAMLKATDTALKEQNKQCEEDAEAARQAMQAAESRRDEVESKYEREVNNHALKIGECNVAKVELDKARSEGLKAKQALMALEQSIQKEKDTASSELASRKHASSEAEARLKQLETHNELLHAQLDARLESLQRNADAEGGESDSGLQEVLRFVRKEKEVAVARLELAEQESTRWRHKASRVQSQVEDAQKHLQEEIDRNESQRRTQGELKVLMQHVAELNELREKNLQLSQKVSVLEGEAAVSAGQQEQAAAAQLDDALKANQEKLIAAEAQAKAKEKECENWKKRIRAEVQQRKAETATAAEHLSQSKEEGAKAAAALEQLRAEKAAVDGELAVLTQARGKLDEDMSRAKGSLGKMRAHIDRLKTENAALNQKLDQLKAAGGGDANVSELQTKIKLLEDKLSRSLSVQSELDALKRSHSEEVEQHEQMKSRVTEALTECQSGAELGDALAKLSGSAVQKDEAAAAEAPAAAPEIPVAQTPPTAAKGPFLANLDVTADPSTPVIAGVPKQLPVPQVAQPAAGEASKRPTPDAAPAAPPKRMRTVPPAAAVTTTPAVTQAAVAAPAEAAAVAPPAPASAPAAAPAEAAVAKPAGKPVAKPAGKGAAQAGKGAATPASKAAVKSAGKGAVNPAGKAAAPPANAASLEAAAKAAAQKAAAASVAAQKAAAVAAKGGAATATAAPTGKGGAPAAKVAKTGTGKGATSPAGAAKAAAGGKGAKGAAVKQSPKLTPMVAAAAPVASPRTEEANLKQAALKQAQDAKAAAAKAAALKSMADSKSKAAAPVQASAAGKGLDPAATTFVPAQKGRARGTKGAGRARGRGTKGGAGRAQGVKRKDSE